MYVIDNKKITNSQHKNCSLIDNVNKLAKLITHRLKDLNLSKAELSRRVGVSRSYIVNMANGTAPTVSGQYEPSPEVTEKLAIHLQVEPSEILDAMGYTPTSITTLPAELRDIPFTKLHKSSLDLLREFCLFLLNRQSQSFQEIPESALQDIERVGTLDDTGRKINQTKEKKAA